MLSTTLYQGGKASWSQASSSFVARQSREIRMTNLSLLPEDAAAPCGHTTNHAPDTQPQTPYMCKKENQGGVGRVRWCTWKRKLCLNCGTSTVRHLGLEVRQRK